MQIRFHQLEHAARDIVRSIESKGHAPYIRALMLKRTPLDTINIELSRLSLAGVEDEYYEVYFKQVMVPLIQRHGLFKYYSKYERSKETDVLQFAKTFGTNENHRIAFCKLVKLTQTESFFSSEIKAYFGENIPLDEDGSEVFSYVREGKTLDILLHEKRHIIDTMLSQGYTPGMISQLLEEKYDIVVSDVDISSYGRSFMNVKVKSMEAHIEELQNEKHMLETQIAKIRASDDHTMGEKTVLIASLKNKIIEMDRNIKNAQSAHSVGSFAAGTLEYSHIRTMFADVVERSYQRFLDTSQKTEYNVIPRIAQIVNTMAKATEKIIQLDDVMSATQKKSINEEMLEVINPTLDRIEQEERQAQEEMRRVYALQFGSGEEGFIEGEITEILGDEE